MIVVELHERLVLLEALGDKEHEGGLCSLVFVACRLFVLQQLEHLLHLGAVLVEVAELLHLCQHCGFAGKLGKQYLPVVAHGRRGNMLYQVARLKDNIGMEARLVAECSLAHIGLPLVRQYVGQLEEIS